jgi:predicted RNA binding protein YcfA (HicA-like mRNA interferase family)
MGGNLYPELVPLLAAAGCTLLRQGKGSHEVWVTRDGQRVSVPRNTLNRHTANAVLNQARLKKAF